MSPCVQAFRKKSEPILIPSSFLLLYNYLSEIYMDLCSLNKTCIELYLELLKHSIKYRNISTDVSLVLIEF